MLLNCPMMLQRIRAPANRPYLSSLCANLRLVPNRACGDPRPDANLKTISDFPFLLILSSKFQTKNYLYLIKNTLNVLM